MKYFLVIFILIQSLSLFCQDKDKSIVLKISILKNNNYKIRRILWFNRFNIRGEELTQGISQPISLKISTNHESGILRVIISSTHYYEYFVSTNDDLLLEQLEEKIILKSSGYFHSQYDLSIDSLVEVKVFHSEDPIKKYLHPDHLVDWNKNNAFTLEKIIKSKALIEVRRYYPKVNLYLDSLKKTGKLSQDVANFYINKTELQKFQIELLEGNLNEKQIGNIIQLYSEIQKSFPERYLYKFIELAVDKIYVKTSPIMNLDDGINRNYKVIFDKILNSKWIPDKFKHEILAYYLKGIVHSFPKEQALSYYQKMLDLTSDSILIHKVKDDNYTKLFFMGNGNTLENIQSETITMEEIVKKKQITYIDFWASWCAPCRAEIPASLELYKIYQAKGIDFVYISTDDNANNWQKAIKQLGLSNKLHFRLLDSKNFKIAHKFKIISIPRYILIDKNGEVINSDAPRPSDPKIRILFDELLKK